ncbi:hypothetical protein DAI22_01g199900 [Oryza sativa Japonica Group]|nr:hypothetical protein DAI22_01g199900 [Oryza sativa Japonica Group]
MAALPTGLQVSKRRIRALPTRWTSALHARLGHAIQLLRGHESMLAIASVCANVLYYVICINL